MVMSWLGALKWSTNPPTPLTLVRAQIHRRSLIRRPSRRIRIRRTIVFVHSKWRRSYSLLHIEQNNKNEITNVANLSSPLRRVLSHCLSLWQQIHFYLHFGAARLYQRTRISYARLRQPVIPEQEARHREVRRVRGVDHVVPGPRDPVRGVRSGPGVVILSVVQSTQREVPAPNLPAGGIYQAIHEALHEHCPRVLLPRPP